MLIGNNFLFFFVAYVSCRYELRARFEEKVKNVLNWAVSFILSRIAFFNEFFLTDIQGC
jgi:hypothetical protein